MKLLFWGLILLLMFIALLLVAMPLLRDSVNRSRKSVWGLLIVFPLAALGLYFVLGNSRQLEKYWLLQQQSAVVAQQMATIKDPQQLIDQLKAHLAQAPQSAEGWYLLGKLYLGQNRFAQAEQALTQANQLKPKNTDYLVVLAKANFLNHAGHLTSAMEVKLKSVLESLSEPVDALNLLAVNAYRRHDYHEAVRYWQQALALVPANSADSRTLLNMISQAQRQQKQE